MAKFNEQQDDEPLDQRSADIATLINKKKIVPISKRNFKALGEKYETDDGAAVFQSKTMGLPNSKLPFNNPNKDYNRLGSPRPYHIQEESDPFDPGSGQFIKPDPGTFDKIKRLGAKRGGMIQAKKLAVGGSASVRADGIAQRGKTKGRVC
jgi:hypothetical protein